MNCVFCNPVQKKAAEWHRKRSLLITAEGESALFHVNVCASSLIAEVESMQLCVCFCPRITLPRIRLRCRIYRVAQKNAPKIQLDTTELLRHFLS